MELLTSLTILTSLRGAMINETLVGLTPLDAYIIPSTDAHLSEYVSICDERRAYLSKFTGSAGDALVTASKALLWTDSRYWSQAEAQLDLEQWTLMREGQSGVDKMVQWLQKNLDEGARVGCDPKLISDSAWTTLEKNLEGSKIELVGISDNLVDVIWEGKPDCDDILKQIQDHPIEYSGVEASRKLEDLRAVMVQESADYLVVSELDQVAWLLNLRGADIPYNPFFLAYIIVGLDDGFKLFVHESQLTSEIEDKIANYGGSTHPYEDVYKELGDLVAAGNPKIWLTNCNHQLTTIVPSDPENRINKQNPIAIMKGVKNPIEVEGHFNSHIRDGAAVVQFFAWLEEELESGREIREIPASTKMEEFRAKTDPEMYRGLSFETIMASGPNGALPHYTPSLTNRTLSKDEVLLTDSGGQYLDGTTDVTRTLKFGEPTQFEKEAFTRVLKGFISIRMAHIPEKVRDSSFLDRMARQSLWEIGLDYGHGTGHGIGSYLNVHEGPYGINQYTGGLEHNMFFSNEPGYYHEDGVDGIFGFGIRHENIIRAIRMNTPHHFANLTYLGFEDVTFVPFQSKMMLIELLTISEIEYLNDYHAKCQEKIGPYLKDKLKDDRAYNWLMRETQRIDISGSNGLQLHPSSFTLLFPLFFVISIN